MAATALCRIAQARPVPVTAKGPEGDNAFGRNAPLAVMLCAIQGLDRLTGKFPERLLRDHTLLANSHRRLPDNSARPLARRRRRQTAYRLA